MRKVPIGLLEGAREAADQIAYGSRRTDIPVRSRFIRDINCKPGETASTPMNRLVARGDRDGITLRLYLALLWRCSASPYSAEYATSDWARLLALDSVRGGRRISEAIKRLESENLISVKRTPGLPLVITLLDESGDGRPYKPPRDGSIPINRWIKVPITIWKEESFFKLSTPGLAMMLAILADRNGPEEPTWWSTSRFQSRIGLTESTRARGVKELKDAEFLTVRKKKVFNNPNSFSRFAVRNTYMLHFGDM